MASKIIDRAIARIPAQGVDVRGFGCILLEEELREAEYTGDIAQAARLREALEQNNAAVDEDNSEEALTKALLARVKNVR